MAFGSGSGSGSGQTGSARLTPDLDINDWHEAPKEPRDLKKLFLVAGLGILSWVATYVGMLELIEANMGDLPLVHKLIIGFSVAMLMTMVIWLLDQLFAPIGAFTKIVYAAGYLFLTVISVGFGFGFYWKVLESRSEASRSAEGAVGQVQTALFAASTRLEQLQQTLDGLTTMSTSKAQTERASGTSCPNSKPGDGPRRKLRDDDAARFSFAAEFVKGRVGAVKGEMGALNGDLAKILSDDKSIVDARSGTRNEFMKSLSRKLDLTVTGFNAFRSDPQLKQIRTDLAERADRATFPDTKGASFNCPDPQLSTALKGVVRAIDEMPVLEKPKIAAVEGSEATIEAFRRLTATFYGMLSFKMPPSADELRELQKKAVQSVEQTPAQAAAQQRLMSSDGVGLSKRDYVPLAIALFVDICLLLVSMGRPMNRLGSLVPKMREAERGPVIQILSRFNDIHRDPEIRRNFEVFRHVVFDFHGDYYVAVPLDAPFGVAQQPGRNGRPVYVSQSLTDIGDHQVEAHILANLFTSFEKERIFSRVYSPFLTTRTIQKRLARQGSKFAHARAFRIYRFRDGAWSEIILGAVMGAARRVEAEKRARNLAEGHRLPGDKPASAASPAAEAAAQHQPIPRAPVQPPPQVPADYQTAYQTGQQPGPYAYPPQYVPHPQTPYRPQPSQPAAHAAPYAPPTHAAYGRMPQSAYGAMAPATQGTMRHTPHPEHVAHSVAEPSPEHVSKFGPYAAHVAAPFAPLPPGPAQTGYANNNTSPSAQARAARPAMAAAAEVAGGALDEHKVIAMPGVRPVDSVIPDVRPDVRADVRPDVRDLQPLVPHPTVTRHADTLAAPEETITYELKRETLTATVPVSQAALPEALLSRLRHGQASVEIVTEAVPSAAAGIVATGAPAIATATPLGLPAPDVVEATSTVIEEIADEDIEEDVIVLGPSSDDWTDADTAMLNRFAKRQA